jgi:formylglycine-generating enzyme required for sulfatase activity
MRTTIETMQPLFEAEADSAVLYFGIQLLMEFDPDDTGGILRRGFFEKTSELFDSLNSDLKYRFEFIQIPAGSFFMGDNNSADEIERPAHLVHVSNFQMAKYQLTNLAYEAIMGESKRNDYSNHDNQPVVNMNWYDAYICALKTGCRLPTEAEWEYAARAGSQDNWCFGNDVTKLMEYANYEDSGIGKTWEVGTGLPNEWGLHDVHGNVWEWCQDWLAPYTASTQTNPKGPTRSTGRRVRRGGGHAYHARGCRCSFRWGNDPLYSFRDIGVRFARNIP